MGPLLVLILLFVVMYAAMIRPQQKRAREHQALIAAVEVGDDVMTTAGIFGTVTAVEGDVVSIEISPGVTMRVARAGIGRRMTAELDEYEAGETFDDLDDELGNEPGGGVFGGTVPEETATAGEADADPPEHPGPLAPGSGPGPGPGPGEPG
ncbi:MAG: preprotein translocase subunit YajC [Acidimicrobiia bacterium]|nr:preprotein translocase subunit YajC [Acidimicrobiia bacterium]